ncbi:MAG: pyrroline-5-carboxylate reductase [Deltaproteobacteria bacterium]|nr:MAG: pyrroline-5-carboxylate reductase [Deltaproteobacteria bacterium]
MTGDIRLGVLGAGNMGQALLRGVVSRGGLAADRVLVADVRREVCEALSAELGVKVADSNEELVANSDVVLLCVKPQVLFNVLEPLAESLGPDKLLISVAAGITLAALERALPAGTPVIRSMPNTPCLVGFGTTAWTRGVAATEAHGALAQAILGAVGGAYELPERALDAVTAVSGSGPAYVFHLMEAMMEGGVKAGFDPALIREFVIATVRGAAELAAASDVDPGELRRRVMSPGGTTEAAIRRLDDDGFQWAVIHAMGAARDRSAEMARAFTSAAPRK